MPCPGFSSSFRAAHQIKQLTVFSLSLSVSICVSLNLGHGSRKPWWISPAWKPRQITWRWRAHLILHGLLQRIKCLFRCFLRLDLLFFRKWASKSKSISNNKRDQDDLNLSFRSDPSWLGFFFWDIISSQPFSFSVYLWHLRTAKNKHTWVCRRIFFLCVSVLLVCK